MLRISFSRTLVLMALAALVLSTSALLVAHAQTTTTKFVAGNRVVTTDRLSVRSGTWGRRLGSQPAGTQGTVLAGPSYSKGYYWYKINYDSGVDGWSVQDYLALVTPNPTPTPTPTPTPAGTPSLSLVASVYTIAAGGSTDLAWRGSNVTNCIASDGWSGAQSASGTKTITGIAAPTTYTLTCNGLNTDGSANATTVSKSVYIITTTTTATAPTLTLSVSPTTVSSGGSATLTWSSTNAGSCTATGGWTGSQALSGSKTITNITSAQTYTLTCTGVGNTTTVSKSVSVGVSTPTPTPTTAAPTVSLSASPTSVSSGGSATLTWSSTDATSCTASGNWSGTLATSGSRVMSSITSSQSYTLTCTGAGGTASKTVAVGVVVDTNTGGTTSGGAYEVYQGCEVPPTSGYARTVYIDPVSGSDLGSGAQTAPFKTLATALSAKKILPGDHVVLLPGDHGVVFASKDTNPTMVGASQWIWIEFRSGARAHSMDIRDMSHWFVTGAEVTPSAGETKTPLVSFSGGSQIVFADGFIYNTKDSSGWSASQWINTADAYQSRSVTCTAVERTRTLNSRMGLSVWTDSSSADPVVNSVKALIKNNAIKNFSADGIRPIGSDFLIAGNSIIDEYVSDADGDGNHDDGIQSWALNGAIYQNMKIDHNWVQESTNPNRAWNATMQGINSFDGVIRNVQVTNNVVLASAYHGISWGNVENSLIDHNTVFNPTTNGFTLWIYAPGAKNTVISNNVANLVTWMNQNVAGVILINNYETADASVFKSANLATNSFDLAPRAGGPLDGKNIGATLTTSSNVLVAMAGHAYGSVAGEAISSVLDRLLKRGATGAQVSALQTILVKLGYLTGDSVTGYFGSATEKAIMNFQKAKGFEATGATGPLTRAALNQVAVVE